MNLFVQLGAFSLAISVLVASASTLHWTAHGLGRIRLLRGSLAARWRPPATDDVEGDLLGGYLPLWRVLGAVVGVGALAIVFFSAGSPFMALLGIVGAWIPGMLYRVKEKWRSRENQQEIIAFLQELRLGSSLGQTLSKSLLDVKEIGGEARFRRRAIQYIDRLLVIKGPEAVLDALGRAFNSTYLTSLISAIHASREAGLSLEEAFRRATERMEEEMAEETELAIEEAPLRLVLPMLAGLFPVVIILILFPMAMATLSALAETGVGVPYP